jgi:hypothetical protein
MDKSLLSTAQQTDAVQAGRTRWVRGDPGVGEQFVDILTRSILVYEVPKCSYVSERGTERFVTPPYAAT